MIPYNPYDPNGYALHLILGTIIFFCMWYKFNFVQAATFVLALAIGKECMDFLRKGLFDVFDIAYSILIPFLIKFGKVILR